MAPKFKKIEGSSLHYLPASRIHPADTYFHFSFAHYRDSERMQFGALRVLNDDDIKPHNGFPRHPHRDMEIISYIVRGQLTHWDSATNAEETLGRGNVQVVTAGTGVWHSEMNTGAEPCRLLQIWILPPSAGLEVRYTRHKFEPAERANRLLHIVGNPRNKEHVPLHLNQDVNLYVCELTDPAARVSFELKAGRQAYINTIEGRLLVKEVAELAERDGLEITGPAELEFSQVGSAAHFIVIEMAESPART
ncbi:MAG: pirin family protein [Oligoflexia bacterium]|nr:pirin family protein [Oligoflexia bacterium]